jgi:two-component system sensor histidine kinase BaeS
MRISTRLLIAEALVLSAAVLTAGVIAALIGPPLFHQHMLRADSNPNPSEMRHVEEAFQTAGAISLGVAMLAAAAIALIVTWYLTRRFQAPLTKLTHAALEVAGGRYNTKVPDKGAGPELDSLANAFNSMGTRLSATEDTRRRLLSDLAHELRTPIATLNAYLEGLDDGIRDWDQQTRAVLGDQVSRLALLAEDIDAVSRAEEGRLTLVPDTMSVVSVIEAARLAVHASYAAKGVSLRIGHVIDQPVTWDRARILQVLTNLLENARRHTPAGGSVEIAATKAKGLLMITITDSGTGIAAEHLPHIFERFYRADTARDRQEQGSGIGLTISKAIVEAHEGTLSAYSDGLNRGARFVVRLTLDGEQGR